MDFLASVTTYFLQIFDVLHLGKEQQRNHSGELMKISLAQTTSELVKQTPTQSAIIFEELFGNKTASEALYKVLVQRFGEPMVEKVLARSLHANLAIYLQKYVMSQDQKDIIGQLIDESSIFENIEIGKIFFDLLE